RAGEQGVGGPGRPLPRVRGRLGVLLAQAAREGRARRRSGCRGYRRGRAGSRRRSRRGGALAGRRDAGADLGPLRGPQPLAAPARPRGGRGAHRVARGGAGESGGRPLDARAGGRGAGARAGLAAGPAAERRRGDRRAGTAARRARGAALGADGGVARAHRPGGRVAGRSDMRLVRYRSYDGVSWGTVEGGMVRRLTSMTGRPDGTEVSISDVTLLPPCEPSVIVCVGRNYAAHIRELGHMPFNGDLTTEPGLVLKGLNTLSGPGDDIPYPSWTQDLQYEGELAVVIGQRMRNVSAEEALDHVLGYTCAVDVTARDKQRTDLQWVRAKSADGFCPVGPWLETDVDPRDVGLRTVVNGQVRQEARTSDMIFPVAEVLSYVSRFMTLNPGDLVLTGTPEGVGRLEV